MYDCFIVCRSVTYAQRLSRALSRAGFKSLVRRLPSGTGGVGCGYSVRVPGSQIPEILRHLKSIDYEPVSILCEYDTGRLEEYR